MARLSALRRMLAREGLEVFVATNPVNIYYLSGFAGVTPAERESILVVDRKKATLIVSQMYSKESSRLSGVESAILPKGIRLFESLSEKLEKYNGKVGFEADDLKFNEYRFLAKKRLRLSAKEKFIGSLRKIKDEGEIALIKRAAKMTDNVFSEIIKSIKPGVTEKEIAGKILHLLEGQGGGRAFAPIVAFGSNSAKPHHVPGSRRLKKGEPVLLDFGARFFGYRSDMTRTVFLGKAPEEFKKHYDLVLRAQKDAVKLISPGKSAGLIHEAVVEVFAEKSKWFTHNTGHGVGLQIHEEPSLRLEGKDLLEEGMVVTVEPGLYLPGKFGIRIEDLVVVTKEGFKILSKSSKTLLEISEN